jgi:T3SS (YopN, CesT) and YbjN peptide-binding chaperone 3/Putative bacterial sensory transduction regulator
MNTRDDTQQEVLLDGGLEPLTSLDELVQHCHRALSAQLWTTCCWSTDGAGWKIGDFNFLVVSVRPDANTSLYVQFWSEPRERVLMEVASGEWCPGAIRYVGPAERQALAARGFTVGGRARNYRKELPIDSASSAETVAREVLHILYEVFGYRGQWRLEITRHRGERAVHEPVHTSLTPDDFAKAARRAGCEAVVRTDGDRPVVALRRGRRAFAAVMHWREPSSTSLYSLITVQGEVRPNQPVTDEAIAQVNSSLRVVKVCRSHDHTVLLQMPLMVAGGVTAAWIGQSLQHWIRSWDTCERQFRRLAANRRKATQGAELIH